MDAIALCVLVKCTFDPMHFAGPPACPVSAARLRNFQHMPSSHLALRLSVVFPGAPQQPPTLRGVSKRITRFASGSTQEHRIGARGPVEVRQVWDACKLTPCSRCTPALVPGTHLCLVEAEAWLFQATTVQHSRANNHTDSCCISKFRSLKCTSCCDIGSGCSGS